MPYRLVMRRWASLAFGSVLCAASAGGLTLMFNKSSIKSVLPLLFLGIIILVAIRFGKESGMVGTIVAAIIFAGLLLEPLFSPRVRDFTQRSNLFWMIVGGIVFSELLGGSPRRKQPARKHDSVSETPTMMERRPQMPR